MNMWLDGWMKNRMIYKLIRKIIDRNRQIGGR